MEPLIPAVLRHNVTGGAKRSGLQCSSVWLGHRHVLDWDQPSGPNMAWKKSAHLSYMVPFKYIYWSTIFADVWPCLGPTSVRKLREVKLAENLWHSTCIFFSRLTCCMSSCCFLSMESLLSSIIDFGWGGLVASHFDDYLHIFHCWHHDSRDRFVSSLLVSRIPTMIGCSLTPQFGGKKYCKEILIHFSINLEVRFSLQSIHLLDFIRKWSGILLKTILFCKFYSEIWRFPVFFV